MAKQELGPAAALRLILQYDRDDLEVRDIELETVAATADEFGEAPSEGPYLIIRGEGGVYHVPLPDPDTGPEVFGEDGGIERLADTAARTIQLQVPWPGDGAEALYVAEARSDALGGPGIRRVNEPIDLAALLARPPISVLAEAPPVVLLPFGETSARALKLVLLPEGFTEAELPLYRAAADSFLDALKRTAPFDTMLSTILPMRAEVTSQESGIDDPVTGAQVDTEFDGRFGDGNLRRLIQVNASKAWATARQVSGGAGAFVTVVIANTTEYGGSGGQVAVVSCHPAAADIALHELGHTLFGLADEYSDSGTSGAPTEPNVTRKPDPQNPHWTAQDLALLKWRPLASAGLVVPTQLNPDCSRAAPPSTVVGVGVFEGAKYKHCGVFRPSATCKMRELKSGFCPVCSDVIRRKLGAFL